MKEVTAVHEKEMDALEAGKKSAVAAALVGSSPSQVEAYEKLQPEHEEELTRLADRHATAMQFAESGTERSTASAAY